MDLWKTVTVFNGEILQKISKMTSACSCCSQLEKVVERQQVELDRIRDIGPSASDRPTALWYERYQHLLKAQPRLQYLERQAMEYEMYRDQKEFGLETELQCTLKLLTGQAMQVQQHTVLFQQMKDSCSVRDERLVAWKKQTKSFHRQMNHERASRVILENEKKVVDDRMEIENGRIAQWHCTGQEWIRIVQAMKNEAKQNIAKIQQLEEKLKSQQHHVRCVQQNVAQQIQKKRVETSTVETNQVVVLQLQRKEVQVQQLQAALETMEKQHDDEIATLNETIVENNEAISRLTLSDRDHCHENMLKTREVTKMQKSLLQMEENVTQRNDRMQSDKERLSVAQKRIFTLMREKKSVSEELTALQMTSKRISSKQQGQAQDCRKVSEELRGVKEQWKKSRESNTKWQAEIEKCKIRERLHARTIRMYADEHRRIHTMVEETSDRMNSALQGVTLSNKRRDMYSEHSQTLASRLQHAKQYQLVLLQQCIAFKKDIESLQHRTKLKAEQLRQAPRPVDMERNENDPSDKSVTGLQLDGPPEPTRPSSETSDESLIGEPAKAISKQLPTRPVWSNSDEESSISERSGISISPEPGAESGPVTTISKQMHTRPVWANSDEESSISGRSGTSISPEPGAVSGPVTAASKQLHTRPVWSNSDEESSTSERSGKSISPEPGAVGDPAKSTSRHPAETSRDALAGSFSDESVAQWTEPPLPSKSR